MADAQDVQDHSSSMAGPPTDRFNRPMADPTALTTESLQREILHLRELLEEHIGGQGNLYSEKFRELSQRMTGMESLREEKFSSVAAQFTLVETQRVEQKKDTKDAVDAALTAQKEAVREQTLASERAIAKSEAATQQTLQQLGTTFDTAFDGFRREISDMKERVTAAEASKTGADNAKAAIYALAAFILSIVVIGGIVLASVGIK